MEHAANPIHIAIIPDGNRRWAEHHALHPWEGHRKAMDSFRAITDWCLENPRVSVLTIWCFSTENWKRDRKEVEVLMTLLEEYLTKERDLLRKKGTRLVHSGRKDRIPHTLSKLISTLEKESREMDAFTLHLALDYGGKDEIIRAVDRWTHSLAIKEETQSGSAEQTTNGALTEEQFRTYLDHPELPDIDLIIRTSGEKRTSNFFLWQAAYSEWAFVEKKFPEFTVEDLAREVATYAKRSRRFGK